MQENLFAALPHVVNQEHKETLLLNELNELTVFHRERSQQYNQLLCVMYPNFTEAYSLSELPYIPVTLFKTHDLLSVPSNDVFKVLTSSGTTGQKLSRIYLDRETAQNQIRALARILTSVLGPKRLPMLIIDNQESIRNRTQFTARATAIVGMATFGRHHFFALDRDLNLDQEGLAAFLVKHGKEPFLIFGFTFILWQHFLMAIESKGYDLGNGIMIHGGGWKKLSEHSVDNKEFKRRFRETTCLKRIYNYYGLVEQVGSVFMEGDDGYLHAPDCADVIIRDPVSWEEAPVGKPGVIQVVSLIPRSYPGHSLLTEDLGIVQGIDDSPYGYKGKYFSVIGRAPRTELRGCSDTHTLRSRGEA